MTTSKRYTYNLLKPSTTTPYRMTHPLKAALFDLDGTLIDSEGQYTEFWGSMGRKYLPQIPTFADDIKGTTLTQIFDRYFPDLALRDTITAQLDAWEAHMEYPLVAGAEAFVRDLKSQGVRCAIVTSSNDKKMRSFYAAQPQFAALFDHVLTAEHFTASKPAPDCYLQAAQVCQAPTDACIVFEDAFNGLEAGRRSGIMTVGLATTNSREAIAPFCHYVLDNFEGLTARKAAQLLDDYLQTAAPFAAQQQ